MRPVLLVIVAVALLGLTWWLSIQQGAPRDASVAMPSGSDSVPQDLLPKPQIAPSLQGGDSGGSEPGTGSARNDYSSTRADGPEIPMPETPAARTAPATPSQSITEQMQAISSEVALWTSEDLLNLDHRQAQDGATLFKAYRFAASCIGHPTSMEALDARSAEFQRWHRQNPDNFDVEMLERSLTGLEEGLTRCGGVAEDYVLLAFDFLTRSVERGYLPAQIAIVSEGRSLLFRDQEHVFRHPEQLMVYRSLSQAALANALSQSIPEALELQAEVLYRGYFAKPDRVTGLAYALASKDALAGVAVSAVAEQIIADARLELSPDDLDDARNLSRQICQTLC